MAPRVYGVDELALIGRRSFSTLAGFGEFWRFTASMLGQLLSGATQLRNWRLVLPQMYDIGVKSVGVVMVTGMFAGMVLAVQAFLQFQIMGLETCFRRGAAGHDLNQRIASNAQQSAATHVQDHVGRKFFLQFLDCFVREFGAVQFNPLHLRQIQQNWNDLVAQWGGVEAEGRGSTDFTEIIEPLDASIPMRADNHLNRL